MESATFRKWLTEQGCRFDRHEHQRHEGHVMVTVHREGRKAEVPLGGLHQILDLRVVRHACEELGFDWSSFPARRAVSKVTGSPNIIARLTGQWLSERLDQQFVIENRPGFGSNIATEFVVRAPPDG